MTEIRAAVAIPIMSISIILANRNEKRLAMLLFILACAFHLSALMGLPILFLVLIGAKFHSRIWIISLIPISFIVVIALGGLLSAIAEYGRISQYLNGEIDTGGIHYLSIFLWAHIAVLSAVLFYFWKYMSGEEHLVAYCSALGLFFLLVLHANDNLALRASDVFELFDLFLFMIPLKYLKGDLRLVYAAMLIILGSALFESSMQVVQPYQWISA